MAAIRSIQWLSIKEDGLNFLEDISGTLRVEEREILMILKNEPLRMSDLFRRMRVTDGSRFQENLGSLVYKGLMEVKDKKPEQRPELTEVTNEDVVDEDGLELIPVKEELEYESQLDRLRAQYHLDVDSEKEIIEEPMVEVDEKFEDELEPEVIELEMVTDLDVVDFDTNFNDEKSIEVLEVADDVKNSAESIEEKKESYDEQYENNVLVRRDVEPVIVTEEMNSELFQMLGYGNSPPVVMADFKHDEGEDSGSSQDSEMEGSDEALLSLLGIAGGVETFIDRDSQSQVQEEQKGDSSFGSEDSLMQMLRMPSYKLKPSKDGVKKDDDFIRASPNESISVKNSDPYVAPKTEEMTAREKRRHEQRKQILANARREQEERNSLKEKRESFLAQKRAEEEKRQEMLAVQRMQEKLADQNSLRARAARAKSLKDENSKK